MVINTNLPAETGARFLTESSALLAKSLARLSSGSKIISPEDDSAGLAVSLRFDAQVSRIKAATNNVGNAISFCQTQDGYLSKVGKALDRMSELAVLSQDATKSNADRGLYDQEYRTLSSYVTDLGTKDFNGVSLFSGNNMMVTVDSDANTFSMAGITLGSSTYASATSGSIGTTSGAATALSNVKTAITRLSNDRATLGANLARLNYTTDQLSVLKDCLMASSSRIKDVDVAEESTQYARYNILVQAGTAMLAQANSVPQSALRLLGG